MKTIKEIANECNVSEQAIRGWCRRNHVAKDAKGSFVVDNTVKASIYAYYCVAEKENPKEVAKDVSQLDESIIALLRQELAQKDKQINDLMEQLARTTEALQNAQESVKASQLLHANSEQKLLEIEHKQQPEQKKKWWWRR